MRGFFVCFNVLEFAKTKKHSVKECC